MHVYIWIWKVTLISFSLSYFHVSMIFRVKKDNPTMAESQVMMGIERQTSIETEPMTLNIDQLQFAREAALYVMNTKSMEEALTIFTEGLEPVGRVFEQKRNSMMMSLGEGFKRDMKLPTSNSPFRDIVSAPF